VLVVDVLFNMIHEIKQTNKLYLKIIDNNLRWGVFTNSKIEKGEIVEYCHCILDNYYTSALNDYTFRVNVKSQDVYHCLGYGAIYNHSFEPNIEWKFDYNNGFPLIKFYAIRDIKVDEELRHNYGPGYWENKKIKKII
jgi:hypothetical protein